MRISVSCWATTDEDLGPGSLGSPCVSLPGAERDQHLIQHHIV
jgi:hypothetical protein